MPSTTSVIPIIDFDGFGDGTSERAKDIADRFYTACRDVGFAYLVNHGIPEDVVDGMFAQSKRFFNLPLEVKQSVPHPPKGDQHRGYSGVGVEQVSQMVFDEDDLAKIRLTAPDCKESFDMGSETSRRVSNIWLDEPALPGFKAYCQDFMASCRGVQMMVLKALALGMPGVPENFFEAGHSEGDNQLRLLHYPAVPASKTAGGSRCNAHTDFSTCTLLFQDSVGGLEVEDPHRPGVFVPATPIKNAIVFNIGDFMMRWSNDTLKSTLHRVRAPDAVDENGMTLERFSIPYFCSANADLLIDALPGTWSEDRPKKHEPVRAGDYVNMRLNATYVGK